MSEKGCHVNKFEKLPSVKSLIPQEIFFEPTEFLFKDLNFLHGNFKNYEKSSFQVNFMTCNHENDENLAFSQTFQFLPNF